MVVTVFEHSWNKVVIDIGEDIIAMVMTPVSSLLNSYNLCEKGDSWNIHCMSTAHIVLTRLYNGWYQWSFFIFIVIYIGALLLNPTGTWKKHRMGVLLNIIFPYLVMSMILTLWFCLGDGAPPNDRYALIIYMNWGIVILGFLGIWENNVTKICDNSVDTD